jgi:hypothetical protein
VVLGLAITWVLLVPAADWLARHDVGSVKGPLLQTARDAARGRLLTLGAGLFAVGALLFTARNFILSREGQVTDRYTKAIEQLGSNTIDVTIGGIYALERVARDSPRDHPTVIEVLSACIREHSREQWPLPDPDGATHERSTRPDVQAALTVIGRRGTSHDIRAIDLTGANLTSADLSGADLSDANLTRADLTRAHLTRAHLAGAILTSAHLIGADLTRANLTNAVLLGAHLTGGTHLTSAVLIDAQLIGADLTDADLIRADLTRAKLIKATLTNATLNGANLTGANFTAADLTSALWPQNAVIPDGWQRDSDSGRLKRADANQGGATTN